MTEQSVVQVGRLDDTHFYLSAQLFVDSKIYDFTAPGSTSSVNVPLTGPAKGIAIDSTGAEYLTGSGATGVKKFSSPSSGAELFEFGTSGGGTLSTPTALAVGPDGLIYVLDTGNSRIASFNTDGDFIDEFSLLGSFSTQTLAVGSNGWLYTADGNGGGDIYDIYTGNHLGSFSANGSNPVDSSRTVLLASGNYLYLLDQNTGLHVFDTSVPEPATWTLMLAAGVVGMALRRRAPTVSGKHAGTIAGMAL